jgi:hypothetical protein
MTLHSPRHLLALTLLASITMAVPAHADASGTDLLRAQCESRDGAFRTGYGHHRCSGALIDGRGQFTAAEQTCLVAHGTSFAWARTPDDYYGPDRGSWNCAIS